MSLAEESGEEDAKQFVTFQAGASQQTVQLGWMCEASPVIAAWASGNPTDWLFDLKLPDSTAVNVFGVKMSALGLLHQWISMHREDGHLSEEPKQAISSNKLHQVFSSKSLPTFWRDAIANKTVAYLLINWAEWLQIEPLRRQGLVAMATQMKGARAEDIKEKFAVPE